MRSVLCLVLVVAAAAPALAGEPDGTAPVASPSLVIGNVTPRLDTGAPRLDPGAPRLDTGTGERVEALRPVTREEDPARALARPLDPSEVEAARALIRRLGTGTADDRETAARELASRFGTRVVPELLAGANDPSPERRFRARALARSLILAHLGPGFEKASLGGWLGIRWTAGPTIEHGFCVTVHEAIEGNPAQKAGLRGGDRIVAWDGAVIEDAAGFIRAIHKTGAGNEAVLSVRRANQALTVRVVLGELGDQSGMDAAYRRELRRQRAEETFERWLPRFREAAAANR